MKVTKSEMQAFISSLHRYLQTLDFSVQNPFVFMEG